MRSADRIVFVPAFNAGIWSVSANGGKPELLLKTDEEKDRIAWGGKGILMTLSSGRAITTDDEQVAVLESGAAEPRVLLKAATQARYVSTGHIVYSHRGAILAVPFDLSRLAVTSPPATVVEGLGTTRLWDASYAVSNDGTLVYEPNQGPPEGARIVMVDRKGAVRPITDGRALPFNLSVSPDGKRVSSEVGAVNNDIWIYDTADGTSLRFTFEPGDEGFTQWTPDGRRIAFGTRIGFHIVSGRKEQSNRQGQPTRR